MQEFLTINELSAYLSIKESTLYAKVSQKEIPFYKIGRLVRFRKSEIETWIITHKKTSANSDNKAKEIIDSLRTKKHSLNDIDSIIRKAIDNQSKDIYNSSQRKTPQSHASEGRDNETF